MLFSAPPRSDIWGKVFAVSSRVSRGSRVCAPRLQSEINEKPFDFPSKERAQGGNGTVSYAEENVGFLQRREKGAGRRGGGCINKTISSHYKALQLSIFILC